MSAVFRPVRGTEDRIANWPITDGYIYMTTDTGRIYFDVDSQRISLGGSGNTSVLYANDTEVVDEGGNLYTLHMHAIELSDTKIKANDLIINSDGSFYRVESVDYVSGTITANRLSVSGSGGGGGGSSTLRILSVTPDPNNLFPATCAINNSISAKYKVVSSFESDTIAQLQVLIGTSSNYRDATLVTNTTVNLNTFVDIDIPASYIKTGMNYIFLIATIDEDKSSTAAKYTVNCRDIKFVADTSKWNEKKLFSLTNNITFAYQLLNLPNDKSIPVTMYYYLDNTFIAADENIVIDEGSFNLQEYFAYVAHGDHILTIEAHANFSGQMVRIGTLEYNIMWISTGEEAPVIISPYKETAEEINYSIITIPYMVYDPVNTSTEGPLVRFYVNDVELATGAIRVAHSTENYAIWQIKNYVVGENTFTIACGSTSKTFTVNVVRDSSRNLDSISVGQYAYFSAFGRSNSETSINRSTWNSGEIKAELTGFNWYNNGWITDNEGNTALRISNGANVRIPLKSIVGQEILNTDALGDSSYTFEFDFKIRNAINFSKLITYSERQLDPSEIVDPDITTEVVKTAQTEEGVVGKFYGGGIGLCLGTQEAFFKSSSQIVNVRYTDDERVKISIVIDSVTKLIYIYINGVISGITAFTSNEAFKVDSDYLEFNSNFCDLDLYSLRIYTTALDYIDIVQNWIGDSSDLDTKLARYDFNHLTNASINRNSIDYEQTMKTIKAAAASPDSKVQEQAIPVMVIKTYDQSITGLTDSDQLPYSKGNKKTVSVRYFDPINHEKSFKIQNVEIDVQGTSSQGYPRRNFKIKTKLHKDNILSVLPFAYDSWDGEESTKNTWSEDANIYNSTESTAKTKFAYALGTGVEACPIKETSFCLKADYMESSSTHNTGLANYIHIINQNYDALHHPMYNVSSGVRTTIYGFPILLFWENSAGNISFVGKYNFNLDKGATDCFGFSTDVTHPILTDKTYEEVAECWEIKNNQSGGRATFQKIDFDATGADGKLELLGDFEPRYTFSDIDFEDIYDPKENGGISVAQSNTAVLDSLKNWKVLCEWIYSTDVSNPDRDQHGPVAEKYYLTLDTKYDPTQIYYENIGDQTPVKINTIETVQAIQTINKTESIDSDVSINQDQFLTALGNAMYPDDAVSAADHNKLVGLYNFSYDEVQSSWLFNDEAISLEAFGITLSNSLKTSISIRFSITNDWKNTYYERFVEDNDRYRLCKFRNELKLHMNESYCMFYFLMTELLLMYDSRAKNMMIASWGPEEVNGEYIWYPIFYDMDTQLGINNSGVVFWDYDTDASPDDGESIFSGQASVLWNNIKTCFETEYKTLYRALRKEKLLSEDNLKTYYDTKQSDQWAEIVKNIDAYYKYISPARAGEGYITQEGTTAYSSQWYYCLQGDRKLNRDLFFRNRLNYLDSQWLGGSYYAGDSQGGQSIQMRYDANAAGTSDPNVTGIANDKLESNATFKITPYLTQYCTVFFDQTPVEPVVKFTLEGDAEYVEIQPPADLKSKIDSGVVLTQQLVYVYGPQYISSLGDLSLKYLDEFWSASATRLRDLQLGNDTPGYANKNLESDQLKLESGADNSQPKQLLNYLDLSNLSGLNKGLDISGCVKLETFKGLGTNIPTVAFPKGNILKAIYLPKTINTIELIEPQALTSLITNRNSIALGNIEDENYIPTQGLYIEGLTDILDNEITSTTITPISTFSIENSLLKYDTYKMLKKLYDIKRVMQQNWNNEYASLYSKTLRISVKNVDWTPYKKVEVGTVHTNEQYYYRKVDMTYATYEYSNDAQWNDDLINLGIYTKDSIANPITDLAMIRDFIDQKNNSNISAQEYYFRSIFEQTGKKVLPEFTGNIHINNTSNNPISEFDLWNVYSIEYPELTITAEYIDPCYSAQFKERDANNNYITHYIQKATINNGASTAVKFASNIEVPYRTHYDFLGWSTKELPNSIGTLDDVVIYADGTYKDSTIYLNSNQVYFAVFCLDHYPISFINADGSLVGGAPIEVEYGQYLIEPTARPFKDDSELPLEQTYRFIGYSATATGEIIDITSIKATRELKFYAIFEEASVFDVPFEDKYFKFTYIVAENGYHIALNPDYQLQGKVTLPSRYNNEDVVAVASNGFSQNSTITHLFWYKDKNHPIAVKKYSSNCCQQMPNLVYAEMPDSLHTIGSYAFQDCNTEANKKSYTSAFIIKNNTFGENIQNFDQYCFNGTFIKGGDMKSLTFKAPNLTFGSRAFGAQVDISTINLGTSDNLINSLTINVEPFRQNQLSSITPIKTFNIYVAPGVTVDDTTLTKLIAGIPPAWAPSVNII